MLLSEGTTMGLSDWHHTIKHIISASNVVYLHKSALKLSK